MFSYSSWNCFNPRPREGATPGRQARRRATRSFNPRPREGATRRRAADRPEHGVSIHAPVRGRRAAGSAGCTSGPRFNPRPREGATSSRDRAAGRAGCFNPRPREGATRRRLALRAERVVSIHAPVRGRRLHFKQGRLRDLQRWFREGPSGRAPRGQCRREWLRNSLRCKGIGSPRTSWHFRARWASAVRQCHGAGRVRTAKRSAAPGGQRWAWPRGARRGDASWLPGSRTADYRCPGR